MFDLGAIQSFISLVFGKKFDVALEELDHSLVVEIMGDRIGTVNS